MKKAVFIIGAMIATTSLVQAKECTNEKDHSKWMPEKAFQEKVTKEGYSIKKFEIEGSCYEIYGKKDNKSVQLFFDPVTGELAAKKNQ